MQTRVKGQNLEYKNIPISSDSGTCRRNKGCPERFPLLFCLMLKQTMVEEEEEGDNREEKAVTSENINS